jgi:glycerophosphoryl diester phosphodiesterase
VTHPYLEAAAPVAFAHRGGAREAPENSLTAFRRAVSLGFEYIETDIRATADGVPVVFHDQSLNRVTDRVGRIRDLPFTEVKKARIGNAERVHSLQEVLEEFPHVRFNIDVKEDNAVAPLLDLLSRGDHLDRVCIASFSWNRLRRVRARFGEAVCTSLAPQEVTALVGRTRLGRVSLASRFVLPSGPICVQVPPSASGLRIVTPGFMRQAHERGWPVHVWTVNDPAQMNALLDQGVHGIITDRPSVLQRVIEARTGGNVRGLSSATDQRAVEDPHPPS